MFGETGCGKTFLAQATAAELTAMNFQVAVTKPGTVKQILSEIAKQLGVDVEWFVLFILILFAVLSIQINSARCIVRNFNQSLGLTSRAIETVNQDASHPSNYLLSSCHR